MPATPETTEADVQRLLGFAIAVTAALACGETRRPIGEECLRNDDCLSSICAARTCVSAPPLVTGATHSPPEEEPRIPDAAATSSSRDAAADAAAEGG
jgi:hypothetical protein